jgi:UDP-GlcNAc:undecaprenyl-phosphate GlcNAc-1-phosphate transferase
MLAQYKTYLVMLVTSFLGSWLFTPIAIRLARHWGAVDIPNARKVHREPMPRMGGLAVFLGFCIPWVGLYLIENPVSDTFQEFELRVAALMGGATVMLLLGIYDDIKGADAPKKFLVQILAALGLWMAGIRIEQVANPWGNPIELGWFSLPVSVFWVVAVTNAINLLDGIDGLVSGVTAVIALSLAVLNVLSGNILIALLTVCLAGACLGFLPYNHSPARIFLGDSGSLTIGIVLASIGILSLFKEGRQTASPLLTVPLILFGLPLFDTVRVMVQRLARGHSMFKADRNHLHHRLLDMGLNHRQAAWTLYAVAAGLGSTAILISRFEHGNQLIFSVIFVGCGAGSYLVWRLMLRERFHDASRPTPPPNPPS